MQQLKSCWLAYGDSPIGPPKPALENVYAVTSGYRPPAALVAFARREFGSREFFNTHPSYSNWLPGQGETPEFYETLFYGDTYQIGTLGRGNQGDVSGFKMLTYHSEQGAQFLAATSGNPKRLVTGTAGGDRIGQYRNLVVFLNRGGSEPVHLQIPQSATIETVDGITFIQCERTWIAWLPINLNEVGERAGGRGKSKGRLWSGTGAGGGPAGFALEIGDAASHGDYEQFKQAIAAQTRVTVNGTGAELTASDGRTLAVNVAGGGLPEVTRDGAVHDWATQHRGLYQTAPAEGASAEDALLTWEWHSGTMQVRAGGHTFTATMTDDGVYTWDQTLAAD